MKYHALFVIFEKAAKFEIVVCCKLYVALQGLNSCSLIRTSDFFQDWWAEVTHGAKNGGSFSEMMGPSISN